MNEKLARILERICGTLLIFMVLLLFLQVTTRYVFRGSLLWAGEMAVWLFVWITFLGTVVLFIRKKHIVVDIVSSLLPKKVNNVLGVVSSAIVFAFLVILFRESLPVVMSYSSQTATSISVSKFFLFSSLPTALAVMIIAALYSFGKTVAKLLRRH